MVGGVVATARSFRLVDRVPAIPGIEQEHPPHLRRTRRFAGAVPCRCPVGAEDILARRTGGQHPDCGGGTGRRRGLAVALANSTAVGRVHRGRQPVHRDGLTAATQSVRRAPGGRGHGHPRRLLRVLPHRQVHGGELLAGGHGRRRSAGPPGDGGAGDAGDQRLLPGARAQRDRAVRHPGHRAGAGCGSPSHRPRSADRSAESARLRPGHRRAHSRMAETTPGIS